MPPDTLGCVVVGFGAKCLWVGCNFGAGSMISIQYLYRFYYLALFFMQRPDNAGYLLGKPKRALSAHHWAPKSHGLASHQFTCEQICWRTDHPENL
jgi:hypothetical protein